MKMRTLRFLIIVATVLSLPAHALAGLAHRSCQEQMSAGHSAIQAGGCCPGKADQSTPCKRSHGGPLDKNGPCGTCKAGCNWKSPQSYEPTASTVILTLPARPPTFSDPPTLLGSRSPDGLWRPPRFH
jgi:hypothetical protein